MGIKEIAGNFLLASYVVTNVYVGIMGIQPLVRKFSQKIESQTHLVGLLETEKEKQNCNKPVFAILNHEHSGGLSGKLKTEKGYLVSLGLDAHDLGDLEHEVFHICSGTVDRGYKSWRFYLFDEPAATLYSLRSLLER